MNSADSPLERARSWWEHQDDMGGFKTAATILFPGWLPKRSCRAPHREDKSPSFSVYQNQSGEWRFKDQAAGEQGGLVGFVMLTGMDEKQAAHWLIEQAGSRPAPQCLQRPSRPQPAPAPQPTEKLPPMPVDVITKWNEGVDYLEANAEPIKKLAELRGWPVAWAQYLLDCAAVSMPLYHGHRAIGFLVEVPEGNRGKLTMREVGFHCRLDPRPGNKKASWRFVPNEKEHRQSTPALPYIIGGTSFDSARLLVITGGQWDALTFAFAAGWLGEGCQWPEGVCVIGIRGDSSSNVFLHTYGRCWSRTANCLLLPDGDASGNHWFQGAESFASLLADSCRKVAVVGCAPHKDFNDLYRANRVTPEQIAELLASNGMALESGVTE